MSSTISQEIQPNLNQKIEDNNNEEMKVMEKFGVPEPKWILERSDSGLFWRRDSKEKKSRVKFLCDVQVLEFSRGEHELEEIGGDWSENLQTSSTLTMGLTLVMCIAVTVLLPWYIIIGVN